MESIKQATSINTTYRRNYGILLVIFACLCFVKFSSAARIYSYVVEVGQDSKQYPFATINAALEEISKYNLDENHLGCIQVHPGTYVEQINDFYPGGHNLPMYCDLIGMGGNPTDVVIQHHRRSESDPDFTNLVSEIYADGVLCSGNNIVSNLKIYNVGANQNSIEFLGEGTLECIGSA